MPHSVDAEEALLFRWRAGLLRMDISFAPRAQVASWLRAGWRLIPDHDYATHDWAVVMVYAPDIELSAVQMHRIARRFRAPVSLIPEGSNKRRGALSASTTRAATRRPYVYDKILRRQVPA